MRMKELLNKLIEKGWKPFGHERIAPYVEIDCRQIAFYKLCDDWMHRWLFDTDIRTVLSKESFLWQFVCENKLWKDIDEEKYWHKKTPKMSELRSYDYHFEEYRLIESALKDESELESFILDNIKV